MSASGAGSVRRHVAAAGLLAPLIIFLALFYAWPLVSIVTEAVSDPAVSRTLPRTAEAIRAWDRQSPPPAGLQAALVADLRANQDAQALGDVVRRLNSARPGFRSLLARTVRDLSESGTAAVDLASIDARWADPSYWRTIAEAVSPWTDRNLLAAVDLQREPDGTIAQLPPSASANRSIM